GWSDHCTLSRWRERAGVRVVRSPRAGHQTDQETLGSRLRGNDRTKDSTMSKVLIIAEHLNGQLNPSTAKCVSCAAALSPDAIDVLVLADAPDAIAADAARITGVSRVLTVARAENAQPLAAVLAPQIARAADGYSHVFGPSTTFGKDLMPRVAALPGVGQVRGIMAVTGAHSFKRPIYAGNAIVDVDAPAEQTVVATVRTASWPTAAADG